jgi:hypothetical protein
MNGMPEQKRLGRRTVLTGAAATGLAALAAACATGARDEGVQVNLATGAGLPPPPPGARPGEADGAVRAGVDAVRRMTVEVGVEGAGPYRFVVDTGANRSVLSAEIAESLGLRPQGQTLVYGIAGSLPSSWVWVERLTIGDVVSRRVRMPILPRRYLGADGLIGVDVLSNRRAIMDFERERFAVYGSNSQLSQRERAAPRVSRPSRGEVIVPARHRFGQLTIVDAEMGGVGLTAFLDSGAEITVGNRALLRAVRRRPGLLGPALLRLELVSATGQLVTGELATAPPLRLGGLHLANLSCVFADLHTFEIWQLMERPAILIGVDVMRHFNAIELDFGKRNVTFRGKPR